MGTSIRRTGRRRTWQISAIVALCAVAFLFAGGGDLLGDVERIIGDPDGTPVQQNKAVDVTEPVVQAVAPAEQEVDVNQVNWVEGELVAPLPKDPAIRAAAREQARANSAAKKTRLPDVTYDPTAGPVAHPQFPSEAAMSAPSRAYQPTAKDWESVNIKLPDDYELPAEVLRELSKDGTIDANAEAQMEATIAQSLLQDFHGINQTNLAPPDCDLAVGPNHIVLVVNPSYAIYDRCGGLLASGTLSQLISNDPNFLFDPKVVYDEYDNRWVMVFVRRDTPAQDAWITMVISNDTTPMGLGGYYWYNFVWTNQGGWWGDYPDLGYDPDGVYVTTNDFTWIAPRSFTGARIAAFDKAQIYAAVGAGRQEWYNFNNPGGGKAFGLRAAEMKSDLAEYYLINSLSGGGTFLSFWELTGAIGAQTLGGFNVNVGLYDNPPNMQQPNGSFVDCGDARLMGARYYVSRLWTAHGQRVNWGEPTDRSAIEVYIIATPTRTLQQESGAFGSTALYYAYPQVDFDTLDRGIVVFSWGGPSNFPGSRYADFIEGGAFSGSSNLIAGLGNYADGNPGTNASPFRWGDYYGCDIERDGDNRTIWMHGQYGLANGNWDTWVGATSHYIPGVLTVTPSGPLPNLISTGFVGGPFTPSGITYTLQNTGETRLYWDLAGVANWNTPSATSGFLSGGASTNVSVNINAVANGFGVGTTFDTYAFNNCYGGTNTRQTQLTRAVNGQCPGSTVDFTPPNPPAINNAGDDNQNRGVYVTALQDFRMCSVGWEADLVLPQTLTARVYAANGNTRGALLATGSVTAVDPGQVVHYIPINYTFQACQEYNITLTWGTANNWPWWSELVLYEPFDAGGVFRIRDAEQNGGAGNFALPHFVVQGIPGEYPITADLDPDQGVAPNFGADGGPGDRGAFVVAEKTVSVRSFGWEADLVAPQTITARIYESTGLARGALIAEGSHDVTSSGMQWHDVAVDAVLHEGQEYDLTVQYGIQNTWPWWDEFLLSQPYTIEDIRVLDGESGGGAGNFALQHYRVRYAPEVAGAPFDLAPDGPIPAPISETGFPNLEYGLFVEALDNREVYSIGWMADVPEGEPIIARVYDGTGIVRGTLFTEGSILSSGPGMKWHDVPIGASFVAGQVYDIAIFHAGVNEWRWWNENTVPMPYEPYGVFRVLEAVQGTNVANVAITELRLHSCDPTATAIVGDDPVRPPAFQMSNVYPNPVSTSATLDISLDEAGPLQIYVYDVKGRKVATLMDESSHRAGPSQVTFDSSRLPAGVYFVKMQAKFKTLSRKITIVH